MSQLALFPGQGWLMASQTPTYVTQTLNATTQDFGFVFQMPEAATITSIGWRQGTLTGTPGTLRVGLQGVSTTTGRQDGTYLGGASNYVDYTGWAAGNNNTFIVHTLPTAVSLTRGQLLCIYAKPQAVGTWNASNQVTVCMQLSDVRVGITRPYFFFNATVDNSAGYGDEVFLLRSSTKTYGYPVQSFAELTMTTGTNPDEIGLAFTVGTDKFSTYQISGMRVANNSTTAGSSFICRISQNTTVLQTITVDSDQIRRAGRNSLDIYFDDTTLATLNTGTEYIASLKAGGASGNATTAQYMVMPTNGDLTAFSTETIRWAQRQGTGAWSFTNDTRLPVLEVFLKSTAFTGGGSGGMIVHPGMAGGMRG